MVERINRERVPDTSRDRHSEKLRRFSESVSLELQSGGVPVTADGRIDMSAFEDIHPDIANDKKTVAEWEAMWFKGVPPETIPEQKMASDGERLEMLAFAVLHKNLSPNFIVVRSSPYDDIKNKVDTIIIERSTGDVICGLDEVSDTSGSEYQKKQKVVFERNTKDQGVGLKYGLTFENQGSESKPKLTSAEHLPLLFVALPKHLIDGTIAKFDEAPDKQSTYEKKLFHYFMASFNLQLKAIELQDFRLDEPLRVKLGAIRRLVETVK